MYQLPVLIRNKKRQQRFTSPLSGTMFDNMKFQLNCNIQPEQQISPSLISLQKSATSPLTLLPFAKNKLQSSTFSIQEHLGSSKISDLSKRLSQPKRIRSKNVSWLDKTQANVFSIKKTKLLQAFSLDKQNKVVSQKKPSFAFPSIQILVLDLFNSSSDRDKCVNINLKKYFTAFFSQKLGGLLFQQLIRTAQKHIPMALYSNVATQEQTETVGLTTKRSLLLRINELQKINNNEQLSKVINEYCLPDPETRNVFLRDLLDLLSVELFQVYNCPRNCQYVLLTQDGKVISDIAQTPFSTTHLLISQKSKYEQNYARYQSILRDKNKTKNRHYFRQTLKQSFRKQVTKGLFEELQANHSFSQDFNQRKDNLKKAESIIQFKKNAYKSKLTMKDALRRRVSSSRQSLTKDSSILSSQKIKTQKSCYLKEFKDIRIQNQFDNHTIKHDQTTQGQIQLQCLVKYSVFLKNKTEEQLNKIIQALKWVQDDSSLKMAQIFISFQQYLHFRQVISCSGNSTHIIQFFQRYFGYDQYGQLEKSTLEQILLIVIGGQVKTAQIILRTVWTWLQHSGAVFNGILRRQDMRAVYGRNKIVYLFLSSLIFGTNQTTVLDLASQMLH